MAVLAPKCPAAQGLLGDNLICIDFSQVTDLMSDPRVAGWDFEKFNKGCWTTANGKLHINTADFTTYKGTCGFLMRALGSIEPERYSSFTLSVVHTLDISETAPQKVQLMFNQDDPIGHLIDQTTGRQPRKQWVNSIARTAMPNGGADPFQVLFKFSAPNASGGTSQGWQIESIAVNASP